MADRKLKVEILGDASGLSRATGDAERSLSGFERGLSGLQKSGIAAATAVVTIGAAAFSMANAAAEDEKAAAALAKTLQNVTGATDAQVASMEDWISAQGRALGVADDQLRPAIDALVRGTGDLSEAQRLASLAMDISAGTGKDLQAVSDALSKAYNGNFTALKKLDPALADLVASGASADEVFAALGQTFEGQAAAGAETAAGKLQIAKLQFGEMQEEIGAKLIPVLASLASWVTETVIPAIESLVGWAEENWPKFRDAVVGTWQAIAEAWAEYGQPVLDTIVGIITGFIDTAVALWQRFGDDIMTVIQGAWTTISGIIEGGINVIRGIIQTVTALIHGDWSGVWEGFKSVVDGVWTSIKGIVQGALETLQGVIGGILDGIKGVLSGAWDSIKGTASGAWDEVKSAITGKVDDLKEDISNAVDDIVQFFIDLPGNILEQVGAIGEAALEVGSAIISKIAEGIGKSVEVAGNIAADIASAVKEAAKATANWVIDKINNALEFTIPGPGFLPDIHLDPPDIPHLHTGGIFNSGRGEGLAMLRDGEGVFTPDQMAVLGTAARMAIVGEEGPELVDLPRGAQVTPLRAGLPPPSVTVNVYAGVGDPTEIGRAVAEVLEPYVRANGLPDWWTAVAA